jgi:peptidoglycan/LPS O-acetylase OafA/YrhL
LVGRIWLTICSLLFAKTKDDAAKWEFATANDLQIVLFRRVNRGLVVMGWLRERERERERGQIGNWRGVAAGRGPVGGIVNRSKWQENNMPEFAQQVAIKDKSGHRGRYKIIDGWRGVSIMLVILSHLALRFADTFRVRPFRVLLENGAGPGEWAVNFCARVLSEGGALGVRVFFVISGYLITSLLLKEQEATGVVVLSAFYARRFFRIVPPFFVLLLAVGLLIQYGEIVAPMSDLFYAGTFLCNTVSCGTWLTHTWSLSVEEQFYFVWPVIFCVLGVTYRMTALFVIISTLALFSLCSAFFDCLGWFKYNSISFSCIALGCLSACVPKVRKSLEDFATPWVVVVCVGILTTPAFLAGNRPGQAVVEVLVPVAIGVLFFGSFRSEWAGKTLHCRPLQIVGLGSYSLYLWQQIFLQEPQHYEPHSLLRFPPLMIACAAASYFLIEVPSMRAGRLTSAWLSARSRRSSANALASIEAASMSRVPFAD